MLKLTVDLTVNNIINRHQNFMGFKNIFFLGLLIIVSCSSKRVSNSPDLLSNINQLQFMQGTWKGEGWIVIDREKKKFSQTETIRPRVENQILVIDGIGFSLDSNLKTLKVIHDAFGIISVNKDTKAVTMLSYSTTGGKMENNLKFIGDKKLEWSFKDERGGTVRFREDFSKEGVWIENGDYSFDGKNWFPFFQMTLKKE